MTEEKLAVSDFNREELLDILTLLYVQGDKIVTLNNKMQNTIKANRQLRLQQATKRKKNRIANIIGIVFAVAFFASSESNFFITILQLPIGYVIGQVTAKIFMFLTEKMNEKISEITKHEKRSLFFPKITINYGLTRKQAEKVSEEATLEATNTTQYQSYNQEKQDLENDPTFSYFISLIPDNFCKLEDFAGMIVLLKDYRAMNFQEVANLWRTEQHQQQMLQQQKQLEKQLHQNYDQVMAEVRESANRLRQDMQNARNESSKVNRNLEAIRRNGVGIKSRLI